MKVSMCFRDGPIRDGLTQNDNYFRVYTRMQPYLIGLLMGYVFFKTRGKTINIPRVGDNKSISSNLSLIETQFITKGLYL